MKSWTSLLLMALLCGMAGMVPPEARANNEEDADGFFKAFTRSRDGIIALEAPFTQQVITPDETIVVKGSLRYVKPRRVIYRMEDPERVTLVDDTRGYEYDADIRQVNVFDLGNNPQAEILFMGFVDSLDTLRKAYELEVFRVTGEPRGSNGIEIRPKPGTEAEAYFVMVRLYLRDKDYLPWRIVIRNDEHTETHIDIGDIDTAFRPAPQETQIFVPEGTKIVENDRVVETVGPGGRRIPDALLLPPGDMTPESPQKAPEPDQAPEASGKDHDAPEGKAAPTPATPAEPAPTHDAPPTHPESPSVSGEKPAATDPVPQSGETPARRNPKQVGGPRRSAP